MCKKHFRLVVACLLTLGGFGYVNAEWQNTNGLVGNRINALAVNETYLFAATQDSGVFRSGDSGTTWLAVNTGLVNQDVRALAIRGEYLFCGTFGGGVFRSGDNGASWQAKNTGISTLNIHALGGNDSFLFAGTSGGGVCRTSDNGEQWLEVSEGLVHVNVFSIGITPVYVFVGTWGGSAFRTADNGMQWFLVTNGLFHPRENIIPYSFAAADTFVFAGTGGGGVFRGKDSARVWYPFNNGLPDSSFVTALARIEDTLFAATRSGVFRSLASSNCQDGLDCADWVADNDGLADTNVLSFALSGTLLFAGTDGDGVWRRGLADTVPPTSAKRPAVSASARYSAGHSRGSFRYALPEQSRVSLVAYDTQGRILRTYVSSQQSPGHYTVNLRSSTMAAGPVYVHFKAGTYERSFQVLSFD